MITSVILTAFVIIIGILVLLILKRYNAFLAAKKEYPCANPNTGFLLGDVSELLKAVKDKKREEFQLKHLRWDSPYQIFLPFGARTFVAADPAWFEKIYVDEGIITKDTPLYKLTHVLGVNIFNELNEEKWRSQRRTLVQAFSVINMRNQVPFIHDELGIFCKKVDESITRSEYVDVDDWFMRLTLDFIGQVAFGERFRSQTAVGQNEIMNFLVSSVDEIMRIAALPLRLKFPFLFPSTKKMLQDVNTMNAMVADLISKHRGLMSQEQPQTESDEKTTNLQKNNLLRLMLELKDPETGKPIDDKLIISNVFTFMFAGTDTSAHALSFALWELCLNPDVLAKAQKEVDEVLGKERTVAEWNDVAKLEYLSFIIKETLRKHNPGLGTERSLDKDVTLKGVTLKKGSVVTFYNRLTHYHPDLYPEPEKFIPERWTKAEVQKRPKGSYFPFSQGARDCIGKTLATTEITIILATLIAKYNFSMDSKSPVTKDSLFTVRPEGLRIRFSHRNRDS